MNINRILEENCTKAPDIIDIDTESMDFEILEALDTERFRVKLICVEVRGREAEFSQMMEKKGYVHYMSTIENTLYIAKETAEQLRNRQNIDDYRWNRFFWKCGSEKIFRYRYQRNPYFFTR